MFPCKGRITAVPPLFCRFVCSGNLICPVTGTPAILYCLLFSQFQGPGSKATFSRPSPNSLSANELFSLAGGILPTPLFLSLFLFHFCCPAGSAVSVLAKSLPDRYK